MWSLGMHDVVALACSRTFREFGAVRANLDLILANYDEHRLYTNVATFMREIGQVVLHFSSNY